MIEIAGGDGGCRRARCPGGILRDAILSPGGLAQRRIGEREVAIDGRGALERVDCPLHVSGDVLPLEQRAAGAVCVESVEVRRRTPGQSRSIVGAQSRTADEFCHLQSERSLQVEQAIAWALGRKSGNDGAVGTHETETDSHPFAHDLAAAADYVRRAELAREVLDVGSPLHLIERGDA